MIKDIFQISTGILFGVFVFLPVCLIIGIYESIEWKIKDFINPPTKETLQERERIKDGMKSGYYLGRVF